MEDENLTPAEVLRYKFWKKGKGIAIYISECGGVVTLSQRGLFFRVPRKSLCPAMKNRPAYPICSISEFFDRRKTFHIFIHRAVAEVYLRPKNLFEVEVDHLDGNIKNYHVLNLEWVTHEENIRRAVEMRRRKQAMKGGVSK